MADYIEVDTEAVGRDRQTIQSELKQIQIGMNQLKDEMVNLGGMWEGPAHNAFMTQFYADYELIQEFAGQIEAYIEAMEYAEKEYQKCEREVRQAIASIRV